MGEPASVKLLWQKGFATPHRRQLGTVRASSKSCTPCAQVEIVEVVTVAGTARQPKHSGMYGA
jgi:hypothetical protein